MLICNKDKDDIKIDLTANLKYELTILLKKSLIFTPLVVGQCYKALIITPYMNNKMRSIIIEFEKNKEYIDIFHTNNNSFYKRYKIVSIDNIESYKK